MIDLDFKGIADAFGGFLGEYGTALGLAGQGAGTWARARANKKIEEEQAKRLNEYYAKQRQIQAQIDAENAALLPQFTPQAQDATRGVIAQKYADYMAPQFSADVGDYVTGTATAPSEITERAGRDLEASRKKGADYSKNLANLTSFSGLDYGNRRTLADANRSQGVLKSASAGQREILPYSLEAAKGAGKNLNLTADVAGGLGNIAMLMGLSAPKKPKPQTPQLGGGVSLTSSGTGLRQSGGRTGLRLG